MATLLVKCPKNVAVYGKTHIKFEIKESMPFEFSVCGDNMLLEVYINDTLVDTIKIAPFIPLVGDVASVWYTVTPTEPGTYTVKGKVKNSASFLGCAGEFENSCTFMATEGAPVETYPQGETPPEKEEIPWYVWASVGIIGVALLVRAISPTGQIERPVRLKLLKELAEEKET